MTTTAEPAGTARPAWTPDLGAGELKACCAAAYQSGAARLLLGDSLHPGGLELTRELGRFMALQADDRVLDVAAGQGASAILLAQTTGCRVVGLEYGGDAVVAANQAARAAGLADRVTFYQGDAESLPFDDQVFDAVICECAFCTFPDKPAAASEFFRVLRPGGRLGLSDLTRPGSLPEELQGLMAWIACLAGAQPASAYRHYLNAAGLALDGVHQRDESLLALARTVYGRLLAIELLHGLGKIHLDGLDLAAAKRLGRTAVRVIEDGRLGYALFLAHRPG